MPQFDGALGLARMDPRLAEMSVCANVGGWNGPFPAEARAEVYTHYIDEIARVSPQTPVSLCSESPEVWEILKQKLRMTPDRMFCCCGGISPSSRRTS